MGTVRELESRSTAKIGYFRKGTLAFVQGFGEDPNRIRCEFSTENGIVGWISIFDKKLGKPLLKRVEQGQQAADTRPTDTAPVLTPVKDCTQHVVPASQQ